MKKIKNLFIILLSACLVNTWPVYAEEQEYVSEEEREFYEYFNLNKNETIFFDDKEKNVKAAKETGLKSIVFTSLQDIKDNINSKN